MVNWQEAGITWPQPHPHAVRLLRGLVWGQHYRHSNPQCEGGMPGSFELREDIGPDRLQAVEDWLRVEGYAYCFRQKCWRVWTWLDRPGEGLHPDGIDEDENPNEYPSGATINVSMWDMIEKKFLEPGNERTLQGSSSSVSPGKGKRSAGDRKRHKKWREYQESLAAEAAQAARGGTPASSPQRASGGHHPSHIPLGDFLEVAKQAKAKPRPLHLERSGPSSNVESAHRGRMPPTRPVASGGRPSSFSMMVGRSAYGIGETSGGNTPSSAATWRTGMRVTSRPACSPCCRKHGSRESPRRTPRGPSPTTRSK